MRHLSVIIAALIFTAVLQAQDSSVEGVAIRFGTTDPVPRARVVLTRVDGRLSDTHVADADDLGRFEFRGVPAGSYRLRVHHDAFVRSEGITVTVAADKSSRGLTVAMTPTGVITGRIVDEYGDPVANVYVRAALKESTFETQTNDLGEYRLFSLPPGTYIVSAAPYLAARIEKEMRLGNAPPAAMIIVPTPPAPGARGEGQGMIYLERVLKLGEFIPFLALRGESHARVYYPGTTDSAAAAPIEVRPGAVVGAINLTTSVAAR